MRDSQACRSDLQDEWSINAPEPTAAGPSAFAPGFVSLRRGKALRRNEPAFALSDGATSEISVEQ